jgi:hypothetical protein
VLPWKMMLMNIGRGRKFNFSNVGILVVVTSCALRPFIPVCIFLRQLDNKNDSASTSAVFGFGEDPSQDGIQQVWRLGGREEGEIYSSSTE